MKRNDIYCLPLFILVALLFAVGSAAARSEPYYSVHGASYQNLGPAEEHIKSLQDQGYESFYERVDIPGKGKWYRIYIGRYDDREEAEKAAENLKKGKLITDFTIRKVMLPAARAVAAAPKTPKPPKPVEKRAAAAVDPFAKKLVKAGTGKDVPRPDKKPDTAARQGGVQQHGEKPAAEPATPAAGPAASAVGQQKTDPPAPESNSLLDHARNEFKAQRYEQAAAMVKSFLAQPTLAEPLRSQALRLAADASYFLGLKGDAKMWLAAAEQYKAILVNYPDPAAGNDLAYYYLAQCNEKLSFNHEAVAAWDRLISTYPDSEYASEALFRAGVLMNQTGKYSRALERLHAYVTKAPAGEHAKAAYYMIGDAYHLLHKDAFAGQWYDAALKKWPEYHDLPIKTIMNMGNHYFAARNFSVALQVFSLAYNLFSVEESGKTSLFMMARSAEAMGETTLALRLHSLFVEKYPQSSEAENSMLAMATLGVTKPGMKFSSRLLGNEAYNKPLKVLDDMLVKQPGGEKEAALLLLKGDALIQQNRIKEGLAAYQMLLSRFPKSKSSDEGRKKIQLQARSLVNERFEKGDYLAVADLYFQGNGKDFVPLDDFTTAGRMANSLFMTGLYEEASSIYGAMKKLYPDRERESIILLALAKIDIAQSREAVAEEKLSALLAPGGVKNPAVRNDAKATLANLYYKKGIPAKANPLYEEVLRADGDDRGRLYRNYGRSLQAAKLPDKAIANYLKALKDFQQHPKSYAPDILLDIYGGLGDAYFDVKRYPEGIEAYRKALAQAGEQKSEVRTWLTYMIGKGSAELKDVAGAQKSFAQVKTDSAGDFWPKVADYSLDRSRGTGNQNE